MTGDIIIFFENDAKRQLIVTATDGQLQSEPESESTQLDQEEHYPDGKEN